MLEPGFGKSILKGSYFNFFPRLKAHARDRVGRLATHQWVPVDRKFYEASFRVKKRKENLQVGDEFEH